MTDPHRDEPVRTAGAPLTQAAAAVILLHGRGASAEDILGLAGKCTTSALLISPRRRRTTVVSLFVHGSDRGE